MKSGDESLEQGTSMHANNILAALVLTLAAGLSTGIGSALAFFAKRTNTKFLCVSLGFSAGVMIYISFVEMLAKAGATLADSLGAEKGGWVTILCFFAGIAVVGVIDKLVPSFENPHEMHDASEMDDSEGAERFKRLYRLGLLTALAIAIHNFPEGLATFMSALTDTSLGVSIAVAIAIHNIPEGIAVSVPIYYATGSRRKAFVYSFLSGLAEPVGAIAAFLLLRLFFSEVLFGAALAGVAGIMVFISFDELLPAAEKYGEHHLAVYGLVAGMVVMAISLVAIG